MNEFLTEFSTNYTFIWALFIIGTMAVSAIALHIFWRIVLRSIASLHRSQVRRHEANH